MRGNQAIYTDAGPDVHNSFPGFDFTQTKEITGACKRFDGGFGFVLQPGLVIPEFRANGLPVGK
jgi:hypothetical protein